jgi:hypothetical protein
MISAPLLILNQLRTNNAFVTPGNGTQSNLIPLQDMQRDDADVTLIHIFKNSVAYLLPVDDPLFAAHKAENISQGLNGQAELTSYFSDFPAGVIGCSVQVRLLSCIGDLKLEPED